MATVKVNLSSGGKRKAPTTFCWLHYYTSRAVRADEKDIEILVGEGHHAMDTETGELQDIFAEAYLELQQEVSTESALSFKKQKEDPLAILNSFRGKPKKPPALARERQDPNAGGFLRSVPLPARFEKTQQALREEEHNQIARVARANPYQKRKPSRKSIWKQAMEKPSELETAAVREVASVPSAACSCGSTDSQRTGNISSRNASVNKADIWGSKDRSDEIVVRYQCNQCGKTWNEDE